MLKHGLDVYLPLVDDDAVDAVVKRPDGHFVQVQIKARSSDVVFGNAGLFAALTHEARDNYWFMFYSERLDAIFLMTSEEFLAESTRNRSGNNVGKRAIWFNGRRKNVATGEREEYVKERYRRYLTTDFSRLQY